MSALSGLDPFIETFYPDLTVGAIASRRFAPHPVAIAPGTDSIARPEGPRFNSHDREVVVRD